MATVDSFTFKTTLKTILSGISSILNPRVMIIFLFMVASLFTIAYFGLYSMLNVIIQSPATANYTAYYPSYIIPIALGFVLVEFFLFFYLLSSALEMKKRIEFKAGVNLSDAFLTGLKKYPKFIIATIAQMFLSIGGLFLLIVPGVYLGTKSIFFNIEAHNGETLPHSLKDTFTITKGYFYRILPVFILYSALFLVLAYTTLNSGLDIFWVYFLSSIILSFCVTAYTFSSDDLYHALKRAKSGVGIKSTLFHRMMGDSL